MIPVTNILRGNHPDLRRVGLAALVLASVALGADAGGVALWWAPSGASKIRPDSLPPAGAAGPLMVRCARNETDAAQVVLRPARPLHGLRLECSALVGPGGAVIPVGRVEILLVGYVPVARATDRKGAPGLWPDPLLPIHGPLDLEAGVTRAFWFRVSIPTGQVAGRYRGVIRVRAEDWASELPVALTVYDFTLPQEMTCRTAFGFSAALVFRYHRLKTEAQKRQVLDKYFDDLSAHHLSPYDPAPLDPIRVRWPKVALPATIWDDWENLRIVSNEVHRGKGALLIYDDRIDRNVTVSYKPLIPIPAKGLRVRGWYRTALPGQRFLVSISHFDAQRRWMSGRNTDVVLRGSGRWQSIDRIVREFPRNARFVRFKMMAAPWTKRGEKIGLVWFDDLSIVDAGSGRSLLAGGDFERKPRTTPVVPAGKLQVAFDFTAWDRALRRGIEARHFNTFRLSVPGLRKPELLGFRETDPEYPILLDSYCSQLEAHLRAKGWLGQAFLYWFDEPSPDQYPFVKAGFQKLRRACPDITRMITEQVEPGLIGGPNLWCPISYRYDPVRADQRRKKGEHFWWYVCTGPKAPYAGLFIDHPAPELRIWLWQTFKRNISGILIWQSNYWTSGAAYPDPGHPQNPYTDPMSWTSGYHTRAHVRRPWGNGDGRFLYPPPAASGALEGAPVLAGPVDSIRLEQLRDGIEDYEYLCLLRRALDRAGAGLAVQQRQRYASLLEVPETITRSMTDFARDGAAIEKRRDAIARALEELR